VESRSFRLFETAIKSDHTKKVYIYYLNEFMKFAKIKAFDEILKLKPNQIQKRLEDWVMHLSGKKLKATTIRSKLSGIELFLEMNRAVFYKKPLHKLLPSSDYIPGGRKPYTTKDIQKMLRSSNKLRTKALIHFLASTGARPGTIEDPVLRKKHLVEMKHDCKAIQIYDGSKEGYWSFLTPEAAEALDDYFISRKLNGEKLTPESPIFANYNKETWSKKNNFLSARAARNLISNDTRMGGVEREKVGNRYDKASTYGFRKRFNTILKLNSEINSNITEKLMAHKNGLDGVYFTPTREECFIEFLKAIPELTISDEARDKIKIAELEEDKSEIEKLKEELAEVRLWARIENEGRIAMGQALTGTKVNNDFPSYKEYLNRIRKAVKAGKAKDREIIFKK